MDTILDCYTDEAAGLGVPPYMGTYPRYLAGKLGDVQYLTIDDLRLYKAYGKVIKKSPKTNIRIYNQTQDAELVLNNTDTLYVICGVHVPGKYLSALPGTLNEVSRLLTDVKCRKVLCGPAVFGSRLEGGKKSETLDSSAFDDFDAMDYAYSDIANYSVSGAGLVKKAPHVLIAEIETARGCGRNPGCSFCTEPIKSKLEFRRVDDINAEVKALHNAGIRHFRLGKQSDFFAWNSADMEKMLAGIKELGVDTLHIDNVDPCNVTEEKIKLVVKYCTEGNIAALGVESFDSAVVEANNLNSTPENSLRAIELINKHGNIRGPNGMPMFLPGINILFGLSGETKKTHEENMKHFQTILDKELLVRRINVRQVALFPGTVLDKDGGMARKNKKFYWKWRNEIRQKVDNPMLQKLVPVGHVLKGVRMEIHDGNTTFGRQIGTYPLVIGVKEKLEIGKVFDIEIVGHMLRSVTGRIVKKRPRPDSNW